MYSKAAWGGDTDPFISTIFTKFNEESDSDPIVSLAIFEWRDYDLVGVWPSDTAEEVCAGTDAVLHAATSMLTGSENMDMRRWQRFVRLLHRG